MKTLTIIFLFLAIQANAQKPWIIKEMDSTEFVEQFGTIEQYNYQKDLERKSSHKMLCLWTGAKAIWLYNFAMYLDKDYSVQWEPTDNEVVIVATARVSTTATPPVIRLVAPFNEKEQIMSALVTGPADDIIKIFVNYWQLSELSYNDLKSKKAVVKNFVSDKVSIAWVADQPTISVSKNKNAPLDLFTLNK